MPAKPKAKPVIDAKKIAQTLFKEHELQIPVHSELVFFQVELDRLKRIYAIRKALFVHGSSAVENHLRSLLKDVETFKESVHRDNEIKLTNLSKIYAEPLSSGLSLQDWLRQSNEMSIALEKFIKDFEKQRNWIEAQRLGSRRHPETLLITNDIDPLFDEVYPDASRRRGVYRFIELVAEHCGFVKSRASIKKVSERSRRDDTHL